jgi:phenylalanyl-tRNA synthetase beta chain
MSGQLDPVEPKVRGLAAVVGRIAAAREAAGEWFEDLRIADVYQGDSLAPGTKSVTLHLTFRHLERTLTQAEVSESREAIVALVAQRFGGSLRA